jgi:hypothetical protein
MAGQFIFFSQERQPNSEQKADEMHVSPAIAKPNIGFGNSRADVHFISFLFTIGLTFLAEEYKLPCHRQVLNRCLQA